MWIRTPIFRFDPPTDAADRWIECDETLDFLLVARSCTKRPAKLLAGKLRLKTGPYGRRAFAALESISPYFLGRDSGGTTPLSR